MTGSQRGSSAARGSAVLSLAFLLVGVGNYAFSVALAYALSPGGYGVVALVSGFLLFATWFSSAGFPWTVARRLTQTDDRAVQAAALRGALLGNALVATLLGAVLIVLLVTGALRLANESGLPILFGAIACSISGVNAAARGGLQGLFRFGTVAAIQIAEVVVKLGVGLSLGFAGLGPTGATLGILAGLVVTTILSLVALRGLPLIRTRGLGGEGFYRETLPLFVGTAGIALMATIDLLALKVLSPLSRSNETTALYQATVTLGRIPYFLATALTAVVFQYIARHRDDLTASGLYVRKGVLFIIALLAPISLVFIVLPEPSLRALYPASYASASAALRLVAAGTPFLALSTLLMGALQAVGRERLAAGVVLVAVSVEAVGLGVGIPAGLAHGTEGALMAAGASFLIAQLLAASALYVACWRIFAWRPRLRGVAAFVIAAAAFAAVASAVPHDSRLEFILAVAAAAAVYGVVALSLGLLSPGDVRTLRSGVPGLALSSPPRHVSVDGIDVICYVDPGAFDSAEASWSELLAACGDPSPFLRPAWLRAWWRVYGRGREARIIEVRATNRVVGLAFLQVTVTPLLGTRRLGFIGGTPGDQLIWLADPRGLGAAYVNDMLVAPGHADDCVAGLRAWLAAAQFDWDEARLTAVPQTSPLARLLESPPDRARVRVHPDERRFIDTSAGWDAYYKSCSKRQRRHLRYEPRRLGSAVGGSLTDEWIRGRAAAAALEEFIDLHARRWAAENKPGLQSGEGNLYRAVASAHSDELMVVRLWGGGRVLAMQWGFDDRRRYIPYNFAFDPDFNRQSPNNVLLGRVIRRCCEDGHVEVDLSGFAPAHHWTDRVRVGLVIHLGSPRRWARARVRSLSWVETLVSVAEHSAVGRFARRAVAGAVALARARLPSHGVAIAPDPEIAVTSAGDGSEF